MEPHDLPETGKVDRLERQLLEELRNGCYEEGMRFRSTQTAAYHYRVSQATAYRALSRLVKRGYLTSRNGRGLYVRRTGRGKAVKAVGVPLGLKYNPQVINFYKTLADVCRQAGIRFIQEEVETQEDEVRFLEKLAAAGVDCLVRMPRAYDKHEERIHRKLKELNFRCVIINDFWQNGLDFPSVRLDEETGAMELLDHLYAAGHRKVALHQETLYAIRLGIQTAFMRWHWKNGIMMDENSVFYWDSFRPNSETFFDRLHEAGYTALLFSYGLNAWDISKRPARHLERFEIACLDNIEPVRRAGFTAYEPDDRKMAETAIELLHDFDPAGPPPKVLIPGKLRINRKVEVRR